MKEMLEAIYKRRSIRKYSSKPVDKSLLERVVKAGFYAPSARNLQPWHFIIVTDPVILKDMKRMHPYMSMLSTAPAAIIVCGDSDISNDYWHVDAAAATQNILLEAYSEGLGTCWCGIYPREERAEKFTDYFKLPENIKPFSAIAIGYPDEIKETPDRIKADRIHYNKL